MPSATERPGPSRKLQVPDSDSDSDFDYSDEEGAIKVDGIYIPPAPVPYCSVENKGPRLVITQITNNFFKSYAKDVVLGPFHKSFCAIVGPNGSGKSNVIDSMLFVFGYRANKIRSKKLSVLLHNSRSYSNVQSASVCVHFALIVDKGGDDYDKVPGSEFTVSRTVNKDNSSHYTIDNRRVQFKEVAMLLKKHGIDLKHNRFLILQGEVEQIAMMPAKGSGNETGMLEYLEDIIGTTRYKEPLVQLSEKVEDYAEIRTEKLNRLKIVQDEVEVLRAPMQEAVEFLKLENDIASEKNIIYQHNILAIKENSKEIIEEKEVIEKDLAELSEKLQSVGKQKKEKEAELNEIAKQYEIMQKRTDSLKEAYDKANNHHVKLVAEIQQINKDRHRFKDQLAEEEKKLLNYNKQPEETASKIEDCEKAIEKLMPKSEELKEEKMRLLANMKDLTKDLQNQKDVHAEELTALKEVVTEAKTTYTLAENELKMLTSSSDNEKRKLESLERTYEDIKVKIEQLTNETQKLEQIIPGKDIELQNVQEELPSVKRQEAQLINQIRSTRAKVEESRASMQASHSKNRVLDALMQQKREGNCPGVYGRLGDLGAIDSKYDVAISTACGPLDNIVVDTVETGQWCIDFLKQNDIGRVTIIVLEKQQHLLELCNRRIQTPENVDRLFDLIRIPDERIRPAFYYALRDTLVTNELDQASRIAYGAQRFRVVTLKGDLIEVTGAMSGGGNRVMRGRMGQSVQVDINPQEIEATEREMQEQEVVLRQLRQRQAQLENIVANVQPEVNQMKIALERMNIELKGLRQQEPAIASQIRHQRTKLQRVSINLGQVREMEEEVASRRASYEEAAASADVIQQKVDKLTAEIQEKSTGKLKTIDSKLKEQNKQIDKLKTEITKLKVNLKTAERNADKSVKTITTLKDDIKGAENKLLELKDERINIENDATKLLQIIDDLKAQIDSGTEDYNDLKNYVGELVKRENCFKSEKIEMDQKNKAMKEKLDEVQQKIHGFRLKISNLKLQDIPDQPPQQLKEYTNEELESMDIELVIEQLQRYEVKLKVLKPNLAAIDDYRKKQKIAIARSNELDEVVGKWKQVREHFDKLRTRRKDEFLAGFKIIKRKLKEMYQMITIGGDADFELVDTYDPFSEGIQFRVRPPKKTWKHISNLSGGEKTLSSLALVFALHYYKPSPLYVMDEIDAALDFKNVSIIGNYIKERTKNAQFIIISLRSMMFELASHLIGIFKIYDCTKSISIDPRKYDDDQNKASIAPDSEDLFDTIMGSQPVSDEAISNTSNHAEVNKSTLVTISNNESALPSSQDDLFATQSSQADSEMSAIIPATQESEPMDVD